MKEHPILFSTPMVRAILDGKKTQTRRAFSEKLIINDPPEKYAFGCFDDNGGACFFDLNPEITPYIESIKCPYGHPGDRLWVRETWAKQLDGKYIYRADCEKWEKADYTATGAWKPSIHMPRAASRLTLKITDIRVERLHDISQLDAIDEGVLTLSDSFIEENFPTYSLEYKAWTKTKEGKPPTGPSPRERFIALWQSINGASSWESNPWVWVIQFSQLTHH